MSTHHIISSAVPAACYAAHPRLRDLVGKAQQRATHEKVSRGRLVGADRTFRMNILDIHAQFREDVAHLANDTRSVIAH